jgi:hypothetical protein
MAVEIEVRLKPWAERKFEYRWEHRIDTGGRDRTSRQDFRAGYIGGLIDAGARQAFVNPKEVGL